MQRRLEYGKAVPGALRAIDALQKYVEECGLERSVLELVKTRASQINGCAYCIDMHTKDARVLGESEQRLYRAEEIDTEAGFRGLKGERRKLL